MSSSDTTSFRTAGEAPEGQGTFELFHGDHSTTSFGNAAEHLNPDADEVTTPEVPTVNTKYQPALNDSVTPWVDFDKPAPSFEDFKSNPAMYLMVGPLVVDKQGEYTTLGEAIDHYQRWAPVPPCDQTAIEGIVSSILRFFPNLAESLATKAYLNVLANRKKGSLAARRHLQEQYSQDSDLTFSRDSKGWAWAVGKVHLPPEGPCTVVSERSSFHLSREVPAKIAMDALQNIQFSRLEQQVLSARLSNMSLASSGDQESMNDAVPPPSPPPGGGESTLDAIERAEAEIRLSRLSPEDQETIRCATTIPRQQWWLCVLATRSGGSRAAAKYMKAAGLAGRDIQFSIDKGE